MSATLLLTAPLCPPQRYSVSMPGFNFDIGKRLRILLDGVEQSKVVEYDCRQGLLVRNVTDADGKIMLTEDRQFVRRERLRGAVTVEWK